MIVSTTTCKVKAVGWTKQSDLDSSWYSYQWNFRTGDTETLENKMSLSDAPASSGGFYVSEYECLEEIATSTPSRNGNVEFGLAIIIVLISIALVSLVWRSTSVKKPWK